MADLFRRRVLARAALLGLTQQQLSRLLSMDESTLSRALRAENPRKATLERISKGLDLTVEELLGEDDLPIIRPHQAVKDPSMDIEVQIRRWLEEVGDEQ